MHGLQFGAISRFLDFHASRRGFTWLSALVLVPLGLRGVSVSASKRKKGKKGKKKKKKKTASVSPPAAQGPRLAYICPGPPDNNFSKFGNQRVAQRFTASQSGTLRQITFAVDKDGTAGDWVVQLLRVVGGTPGGASADVLASATVPDATVATGETTVTATFYDPNMVLVQGTDYAAALTRPGSDDLNLLILLGGGHDCTGLAFEAAATGSFTPTSTSSTIDLVVSVLVV